MSNYALQALRHDGPCLSIVADVECITVAAAWGDCLTFRISMVGAALHCADFVNSFSGAAAYTVRT